MAIGSPSKSPHGARPPKPPAEGPPASRRAQWKAQWAALSPEDRRLGVLRGIGVLIMLGIPVFLFLHPESGRELAWPGGRWVWTVIIALLPLGIVAMGFYTWRQICPLAFFGRMSEWLGWPDKPAARESERRRGRVSEWLARDYPYVTWGFLAVTLAQRILLTNSNAAALAWTLIGLMALATLFSFRYTGKTWCNFICPVGTIEKLYTDGDRPQYKRSSICPSCTGCKTKLTGGLCPDINQENDYWQEIRLPSRAFAYYAFPGLVLAFYVWYFLHKPYYWHELDGQIVRGQPTPVQQPGTVYDWGYYLSGDWTRDSRPWTHWLEPGFGFHGLPFNLPVILAVPLTLAAFSALSYALFRGIELFWLRRQVRHGATVEEALEAVRHPLFAWAGFAGFCTFYLFAGAPTLRELPFGLYGLFRFGVFVFAAWVLNTRLQRSRAKQLQFDQARKWVRSWPFADEPAPADLAEAYTKYTLRAQFSKDRLNAYKEAVRTTLADNLITISEITLLDGLARDLGVNEAEQQKVVKEIAKEAPEFFDPRYQGTLRDRLRLIGYRSELERRISENGGVLPDREVLAEIQQPYRVQPAEHEEIIQELRDPHGPRAEHFRRTVRELQAARRDAAVLAAYPVFSVLFLLHELELDLCADRDHVLRRAELYGTAGELDGLRAALQRGDPEAPSQTAVWLRERLPEDLAGEVAAAVCDADPPADLDTSPAALTEVVLRLSRDSDLYVQAAALYSLRLVCGIGIVNPRHCPAEAREAARACAEEAFKDVHALLRETATAMLAPNLSPEQWAAALQDVSTAVRRAAVDRLPRPVPEEIQELVALACSDRDERVQLAAAAARDNVEPRLPSGHRLPHLTTLEKVIALRNTELLAHLPTDALHALAERAEEEVFEPGEVLCREGEFEDLVYLLIEGHTEVVTRREDGQEHALAIRQQGECVGEMAVLDLGPRMATVRAIDASVRVLTVRGDDFRNLLGWDPTTLLNVMRLIINRRSRDPQWVHPGRFR